MDIPTGLVGLCIAEVLDLQQLINLCLGDIASSKATLQDHQTVKEEL
jgi:hypothetical protein